MVVPPFVLVYWLTMKVYRWPARDLKRLEGAMGLRMGPEWAPLFVFKNLLRLVI
jgi:hypothetical protein